MNRAFYGIRTLSTKDGIFTNAIFGFINILEKELSAEKPDGVAVAFDLRAPTFRHKAYDLYKANRKGMPEELAMQMPLIKEILSLMGIACLEKEGYEADDIIGTLASMCDKAGDKCVIITGDKDDLQLVSSNVTCKLTVTKGGANETVAYTPAVFFEKYGFEPRKLIDLKALWGDTSDNIPGVAKVGEKTATDLVTRFGTVEEIYANIDTLDIKDTLKVRLTEGRESAFLSKELATIVQDVPLDLDISDLAIGHKDTQKLLETYTRLELRKFAAALMEDEPKEAVSVTCETVMTEKEVSDFVKKSERVSVIADGDSVFVSDGNEVIEFSVSLATPLLEAKTPLVLLGVKEFLRQIGEIDESKVAFDLLLAGYLLDAGASSYKAEGLILEYLGITAGDGASQAFYMIKLADVMMCRLVELGMESLYREIELPLSFVLYNMEKRGVLADRQALETLGQGLAKSIDELEALIYDMSGERFNINSPKQLGEVLFDKLGLPGGKKGKNGAYKTDADRLQKLAVNYPIVKLVLDYRQLAKLKSTYTDGLVKVIEGDGRIHSSFNQTVTVTGRISSTEPNLQNIPVRTELGRELRRMFVADEGKVFVDADYSQIELRVLAHMADDAVMVKAFTDDEDIHSITASQVFGVVTPETRSKAKAVNFGIVYGISAFGLADDIGVSNKEAKAYIEAYFEKYTGIKTFLDKTVEDAAADGFVTTLFGRRRYMPELSSSNFMVRSFGERAARNTPIQGTAADIIKYAMVRTEKALEGLNAKLILQVHDELIIECPEAEVEKVKEIIRREMEGAADLSVPLKVDIGVGKSWYDAK